MTEQEIKETLQKLIQAGLQFNVVVVGPNSGDLHNIVDFLPSPGWKVKVLPQMNNANNGHTQKLPETS